MGKPSRILALKFPFSMVEKCKDLRVECFYVDSDKSLPNFSIAHLWMYPVVLLFISSHQVSWTLIAEVRLVGGMSAYKNLPNVKYCVASVYITL